MRKSRFTESQIVRVLKEVEGGSEARARRLRQAATRAQSQVSMPDPEPDRSVYRYRP